MGELSKEGQATKTPQVEQQVNAEDNVITRLNGAVENLENRLSKVLREKIPENETTGKDAEALVELAGDLRTYNRRLQSLYDRLCDIADRLEL